MADEKHEIRDFIEAVKEAAIEAEFETGVREATVEEAKAHIVIRLAKIIGGFALVILGIILMPLPGPGWVIVAAGLAAGNRVRVG
ncbi:MAG: PGPGW domain-containing protein [Acidimicrobiales bacterium]